MDAAGWRERADERSEEVAWVPGAPRRPDLAGDGYEEPGTAHVPMRRPPV
ncbi:hypothetical protein [Geodermatophilus obscurus]|nr:hypothetical protein [Geodermatophilus obscurus]